MLSENAVRQGRGTVPFVQPLAFPAKNGGIILLVCGKIVNTHGLRGEVKALYYTDGPDFFENVKKLYLSTGKEYRLVSWRVSKGAVLLRLDTVDSVEKAEALAGKEISVSRSDLPPLPEGRYYIADILGMTVVTDEGRDLGRVVDVFKTGANDVYSVRGDKEYLIPVIDEVVLSTSLEEKRITIKPLKGLLDDED
ncbi:MAG: 16S rRNA processing protein RimM [Ruminococcaceae bacterium]|nr:16S rRNA processing protein RimM [Oscillospiraceae bacterium]